MRADDKTSKQNQNMFQRTRLAILKLEALARLAIKLGSLIFMCPTRYTSSFHRKSWIWHFTLQQLFEYLLWKAEFWETKNELFLWIVSVMEKQQTKPSIYYKFETQPFSFSKWKAIKTIQVPLHEYGKSWTLYQAKAAAEQGSPVMSSSNAGMQELMNWVNWVSFNSLQLVIHFSCKVIS